MKNDQKVGSPRRMLVRFYVRNTHARPSERATMGKDFKIVT